MRPGTVRGVPYEEALRGGSGDGVTSAADSRLFALAVPPERHHMGHSWHRVSGLDTFPHLPPPPPARRLDSTIWLSWKRRRRGGRQIVPVSTSRRLTSESHGGDDGCGDVVNMPGVCEAAALVQPPNESESFHSRSRRSSWRLPLAPGGGRSSSSRGFEARVRPGARRRRKVASEGEKRRLFGPAGGGGEKVRAREGERGGWGRSTMTGEGAEGLWVTQVAGRVSCPPRPNPFFTFR